MAISDVIWAPGRSGFFADDQAAIRADGRRDGFGYAAAPVTPGFTRTRQPGEALSVLLVLDDGRLGWGDCAVVQYPGVGGREPPFSARQVVEALGPELRQRLLGQATGSFRALSALVEEAFVAGQPVPAAVRYGLSQALLDAVATTRGVTMAEVIRDEYATGSSLKPVPLFVQCGDDRYDNVDKMVLKQADVLPHGLVNNVATRLGADGSTFADYVAWVRDRVRALGPEGYFPVLQFDTYGTIGAALGPAPSAVAGYLARLGDLAAPYRLRVEHPVDAGSTPGQVEAMASLRQALDEMGSPVEIVADEWCNTLDDIRLFVAARAAHMVHVKTPDLGGLDNTVNALLEVRAGGLLAYCGGSANETDRCGQVCAHVAMACAADQVLAKPGMGVDEAMMVVGNEMARVSALVARRPR